MLLKSCNRCGALIPYGHAYCSECEPIVEKQKAMRRQELKRGYDKAYNKTRDPKYSRFYNSNAWKSLALRYTQDKQYKCERCGQIATEVHHKKAIQTADGWELRLDYNNLELLCRSCHNDRHNRFKKGKKNRHV